MNVTLQDCREARFCSKGIRTVIARHRLDLQRFLKEGLPIASVEHIADPMIQQVIANARKRCDGR